MIVGLVAVALGLVLVAVAVLGGGGSDASSSEDDATVTVVDADLSPPSTAPLADGAGLGTATARSASGRDALAGFGEAQVTVTAPDGETCVTCLLVASEQDQRERGLMEVTDPALGGYDGMLFVYDEPIEGSFWMRNTPMELAISYVDAAGTVLDRTEMEPCADVASCPSYPASGAFQYAIEVPVDHPGDLDVSEGSTIAIDSFSCSSVTEGG